MTRYDFVKTNCVTYCNVLTITTVLTYNILSCSIFVILENTPQHSIGTLTEAWITDLTLWMQ